MNYIVVAEVVVDLVDVVGFVVADVVDVAAWKVCLQLDFVVLDDLCFVSKLQFPLDLSGAHRCKYVLSPWILDPYRKTLQLTRRLQNLVRILCTFVQHNISSREQS